MCTKELKGCSKIETWLLKSTHKISHAARLSAEAEIWKEPGLDTFIHLGEPPREGRRQLGLPLGTKILAADILGSSFYNEDTVDGWLHLGVLLLFY